MIPLKQIGGRLLENVPGSLSVQLWDDILPWLESGGMEPSP